MSDYALAAQPTKGVYYAQASKLAGGTVRVSTHAGSAKQPRHHNRA